MVKELRHKIYEAQDPQAPPPASLLSTGGAVGPHLIELNMSQKSLKLPCGVENDELNWNRVSAVAKNFDAIQCERQNELWSRCQQRMEDNDYDHTTISHPNGNWEVVIDFETAGNIAYRWYLLAEEK